jgi:hypothetical protein
VHCHQQNGNERKWKRMKHNGMKRNGQNENGRNYKEMIQIGTNRNKMKWGETKLVSFLFGSKKNDNETNRNRRIQNVMKQKTSNWNMSVKVIAKQSHDMTGNKTHESNWNVKQNGMKFNQKKRPAKKAEGKRKAMKWNGTRRNETKGNEMK